MSDVLRLEDSNGLATYPGPTIVPLDAAVNGELGKMMVSVGGYGQVPAAANRTTGTMRGIIVDSNDNTAGGQGALSVTCRPGKYRFKNSGANPCSAATCGGSPVYAEDGETIGTLSTAGPLAGFLSEFVSSDAHPCYVVLKCWPALG